MTRRSLLVLALIAGCAPAGRKTEPTTTWEVSLDGAGPIRFGSTVAEAAVALKTGSADRDTSTCHYWKPEGAPAGLSLMIEAGKVVRADVDSPGVASKEGLQVGASLAAATAALGPNATLIPHKYRADSGWKYLTLLNGDSSHAIVAELDGRSVRTWRAGLWPAAGYVERCS